jgi:hypothetical protein
VTVEEENRVPFLSTTSFAVREIDSREEEAPTSIPSRSPFISVYESEDSETAADPAREAYAGVVESLYTEEFDEALFELINDARGLHQDLLAAGHAQSEADRLLTQRFDALAAACEAGVDAVARQIDARGGITDEEIQSLTASQLSAEQLEPAFENFLGGVLKKVGKLAMSGIGALANVALGPMVSAFKAAMRPFLDRVLQTVIGRLPEPVRPAARKLAERLGLMSAKAVAAPAVVAPVVAAPVVDAAPPPPVAAPTAPDVAAPATPGGGAETTGSPVQPVAGPNPAGLQEELDGQIAQALLAREDEEVAMEMEVARIRGADAGAPVFSNLDEAREELIQGLEGLQAGESAEPLIQNFLPALLPALQLGIKIAGRPSVIRFLSPFLAKLIAKLIGPEQAPALASALVDAGLKLMSLEASEEERAGAAASAVAATVEETLCRVAALDEHVLDDRELLEGFALEAFEQAAAANLPAVLSETVYQQRPGLLEGGVNAAWLYAPRHGRRGHKRCSRSFSVTITPHMADEVESFEGAPLSEVLQEQLGLPEGNEVQAEVYLYEALPGTTIGDIARGERETMGRGGVAEVTEAQLHPLTPEAANVLLGKPGLGRPVADLDRRNIGSGQRLYHLAIPGARSLIVPGVAGRRRVRRLSHLNVVLDGAKDEVRVTVFLSETRAQKLAVRLRQQSHAGALAVGFHKFLARRLGPVFAGRYRRRLRIVHAGVTPGQPSGHSLQQLPPDLVRLFAAKMREWLTHAFASFAKERAGEFLAAAENPAIGVTLRFTIAQPKGLKELLQALAEKGSPPTQVAQLLADKSPPNVRVDVLPGHSCA